MLAPVGTTDDVKAAWLALRERVEELAGERQHYLDFFERASEAYLVTDLIGTIQDANGAAVDVLQRRKRFLRGKPLAVFIAEDQRREFRDRLHALAAPSAGAETSWRTAVVTSEARIPILVAARPSGRMRGGAGGICWLLRPAT